MRNLCYLTRSFCIQTRPTQPLTQWIAEVPSLGSKWPERKTDHSPKSNYQVENAWDLYIYDAYVLPTVGVMGTVRTFSRGTRFVSRTGHRLSWLYSVSPGRCQNRTFIRPRPLLSESFPTIPKSPYRFRVSAQYVRRRWNTFGHVRNATAHRRVHNSWVWIPSRAKWSSKPLPGFFIIS
jgi:hypothetical protein